MDKYFVYNLFNLVDFNATGLVSRMLEVDLERIGLRNILITKSNIVSILYEDTLLGVNLNGQNPFESGNYAVFLDENNDVWLGISKDLYAS